jgi:hypothetical protein
MYRTGDAYLRNTVVPKVDIPLADTNANTCVAEVVGNKNDTATGTSIVSNTVILKNRTAFPAPDSANNLTIADVVGNKNDTGLGGTSIVARVKQVLDTMVVPIADSVNNMTERDVVGNKNDTVAGTSLMSVSKVIKDTTNGIKAKTDNLPANTATELTDIDNALVVIDNFQDVPAQDAVANLQMRDVIGNKTDTIAGDSLVALTKVIDANVDTVKTKTDNLPANTATELTDIDNALATVDGFHDVPAQDSAANAQMRDVIGNKTDTPAGNSICSKLNQIQGFLIASNAEGTYAYTNAGGEQTIYENTEAGFVRVVNGIWLDLVNMTQNGTIRLYYKIDGTNYRLVTAQTFTVATDPDGVYINVNMGVRQHYKITYEESVDEGADRNVPYLVTWEVK